MLYSEPVKVHFDPAAGAAVRIELTKTIPAVEAPADTKFVKHVRIQSKVLTAFWGRPMFVGAIVLLPDGFDEHPDARYPVKASIHRDILRRPSMRFERSRRRLEAAWIMLTSSIRTGLRGGCRAC